MASRQTTPTARAAVERDREIHDPDIHWLLNAAAAELGARSNHGGVVSILEHGGFPSGVPETDIYSDRQVGWCAGPGSVERWRLLMALWRRLDRQSQAVLVAHYCGARGSLPDGVWARVEGALGKLAAASLWVHEGAELAELLEACVDRARRKRDATIRKARQRAEGLVRAAHRAWQAVKRDPEPGWAEQWEALQRKLAERATSAEVAP